MPIERHLNRQSLILALLLSAGLIGSGCRSNQSACCNRTPSAAATGPATKPEPAATSVAVTAVAPATVAPVTPGKSVIRIKAGMSAVKDSAGNLWLADQGFEGGDVVERPDIQITNTKDPEIYRSERYAMESFATKLPNGRYQVKLHFAETFEGITGPGERVFSFNVEGREFKDFDVWQKAGGGLRAYIETVDVEVADGQLDIKFTSQIENPEINGIEIIPQP